MSLQTLWLCLIERGYQVTMQWIPRYRNREADELCNAALDGREPNTAIISTINTPTELDVTLNKALRNLSHFRVPTLRTIPDTLQPHWSSLMSSILTNPLLTEFQRHALLLLAPHLISTEGTRLMNRDDYKRLRQHFTLLLDFEYMTQTVEALTVPPVQRPNLRHQPNPVSLIRRGAAAQTINDPLKPLPQADIVHSTIQAQFPSKTLPDPLQIQQSYAPTNITFSEILATTLKTAKARAPSLSGWSRELLLPILLNATTLVKTSLAQFFMKLANGTLAQPISHFITCTPCTPINTDKLRPVCLRDFFVKVTVKTLLDRIIPRDPLLTQTSSTFSRKGGSGLLASIVQQCIDEGHDIVGIDCSNAFNETSRRTAFAYLQAHAQTYADIYPLINLLYAQPTIINLYDPVTRAVSFSHQSTTGTVQGCPSSTWFFTISILVDVLIPFRATSVSFVDDIYLVRDSLTQLPRLTTALNKCDLQLNPTKCRFISARPLPPSTARFKHENTVSRIGGGYVVADRQISSTTLELSINKVLHPFRERISRVQKLNIPNHYKLAILQHLQWSLLYAVTSSTTECARFIASVADELNIGTFARLTQIPSDSLHVRFFTQSEDGGYHVFPLSMAQPHLRTRLLPQINIILKELKMRPLPVPTTTFSSIKQIWSFVTAHLPRRPFINSFFFGTVPRLHALTLNDEIFRFAILQHLEQLDSITYTCRHSGTCLSTLSPTQRFEHVASCTSCGAPSFHSRHRSIVEAMTSTCRRHNIAVECNPKDLPRVGNTKGGADLLIWRGADWYSVDVTVSRKPNVAYAKKELLYARYATMTNSIILPAVVSPFGQIHRSTWQHLLKIATGTRGFISDMNLHIQYALIIGQYNGIARLRARTDDSTTEDFDTTYDEHEDTDSTT